MRSPPTAAVIRRSASFDTIATQYLCGEWPRATASAEQSVVMMDKTYSRGSWPMAEASSTRETATTSHLNRSACVSASIMITMSDKWTQVMVQYFGKIVISKCCKNENIGEHLN